MHHRVAFAGRADWLMSSPLRAVRQDRRIITVALSLLETFRIERVARCAEIVVLQFDGGFKRGLATLVQSTSHGLRMIAVTRFIDESMLGRIVAGGAWGHVGESSPPDVYCEVIAQVGAGRLAYPPAVLDRIETCGGRMTLEPAGEGSFNLLTAEEHELLKLLWDGLSAAKAARVVGVSARTAQRRRESIMKKVGASNQTSLLRLAIRAGVIDP